MAFQKFLHFYKYGKNWFSPNVEGVAQKLDLPCPFDVLDTFGRKSKSEVPRALKFCTKWVPIKVNNWWKFDADIYNDFWEIKNWKFFGLNSPPSWKEKSFWKVFSFQLGGKLRFESFLVWVCPLVGKKIIFKNYFLSN